VPVASAAPTSPCSAEARSEAAQAYTGKPAVLPDPGDLPVRADKNGDAFTVWGAIHALRGRYSHKAIDGKTITLVGVIVRTNYDDVPDCGIHRMGRADPADCRVPIPMFAIADNSDERVDVIEALGWASNFAQLYSMIEAIDNQRPGEHAKLKDEFWASDLPNPVPAVGARVRVTGRYTTTFTKATSGVASNTAHGILTVDRIEYLEPPREKVYLRGMKPKRK
jgi:hypothetical protein